MTLRPIDQLRLKPFLLEKRLPPSGSEWDKLAQIHYELRARRGQNGAMSYARLGNGSSVYVFGSDRGYECCWCTLTTDRSTFITDSPAGMLRHLLEHRK